MDIRHQPKYHVYAHTCARWREAGGLWLPAAGWKQPRRRLKVGEFQVPERGKEAVPVPLVLSPALGPFLTMAGLPAGTGYSTPCLLQQ